MVTRVVTQFICDICAFTTEGEKVSDGLEAHPYRTDIPLPEGWVEVIGNSRDHEVLNLQLCPECIGAIQEALLESRDISEEKLLTASAHPGTRGS